ncbi:N(G),N(G)-dimethylarginine dimethylaminohydrolase [bacterium]|nr:N(G),N(G)-dimethylarginine dimethylaminohydrolase [bacterium]
MFTKAIVRIPGKNFHEGITSFINSNPDYRLALKQHKAYLDALRLCGLELNILEPDLSYPDGTFVEDTAIVTEKVAVITRPGNKKRRGEEKAIKKILSGFKPIEIITAPGRLDGGDILRVENHFFTGLSSRTNIEGAKQLEQILIKYGYTSSMVNIENILHLKSGINYIGENNLVISEELAGLKEFYGFNKITVGEDEIYAANCVLINDFLLIPLGYPVTKEKLENEGYKIIEIEMSEFRKMDGGLTCLSLRF